MKNLDRCKLANQIALDTCDKTAIETVGATVAAAQNQTPPLTDQEFNTLTQTVNQFRGIFTQAIQQDQQLAARAAAQAKRIAPPAAAPAPVATQPAQA